MTREIVSPVDQEATCCWAATTARNCGSTTSWFTRIAGTGRPHPEQDAVKVKLKKGTNRILLKINNGNGGHGFYLTVLSEQELKALPLK